MTDDKRACMDVLASVLCEAHLNVLRSEQYRFENYMTANRWDTCCAGGIYEDEGLIAVACFIEYIERGMVTDGNGKELEA